MVDEQQQAATSEESRQEPEHREQRESCTPYFDALWFCYSPVYQMKQYYIYGTVDDCQGHWRDFYNCLKKRTVFRDQVPEDPRKSGKHPLWELRTQDEAQECWRQEFGHLSANGDGQQEQAQGQTEPSDSRHTGKATLV